MNSLKTSLSDMVYPYNFNSKLIKLRCKKLARVSSLLLLKVGSGIGITYGIMVKLVRSGYDPEMAAGRIGTIIGGTILIGLATDYFLQPSLTNEIVTLDEVLPEKQDKIEQYNK
jgi:hypothetical protein